MDERPDDDPLRIGLEGDAPRTLAEDEVVLVEAREILEADDETEEDDPEGFDDEDEDGPDFLRVRLEPLAVRTFIAQALRLIGAGRPPCPLCGQPLDPQGHLCPRRNGHAPLLN